MPEGGLLGRIDASRIGWVILGRSADEAYRIAEGAGGADARVAATPLDRYEGASGLALLQVERALERSQGS